MLTNLVRNVPGVLEYRRALEPVSPLQHDVLNSQSIVPGQIRWLEAAVQGLLPAEPPLLAKVLKVIHLASAFPIDVHSAQGFGTENARVDRARCIGEQEDSVLGS